MFNYPIEKLIANLKDITDDLDICNNVFAVSTINESIDLIITMFNLLNKEN